MKYCIIRDLYEEHEIYAIVRINCPEDMDRLEEIIAKVKDEYPSEYDTEMLWDALVENGFDFDTEVDETYF